jgi:signal transduction histidine kinase
VVFVQGNAVGVYQEDTGARHYIGCVVDITERQRAVAEIVKAKEMAISADQAKGRLMRTVAHEFRTPLSLLASSFDILDRYGDNLDEQRRKTQEQHSRSAASQLTALVKTLLSYNKKEKGQDLELWSIEDIETLMRTICEEASAAWSTGQSLQLSFPEGHGVVKMNEAIFRSLFGNIIVNAYQYSPAAGGVFVRVLREDRWLFLEVRDQGVGVLPEDRERVFDDFYRGQNVGGQRGMGLGLGIARDAARRLGGVIELADSHQTGTTVTIKIPFADQ